jgi:hypothetical protein
MTYDYTAFRKEPSSNLTNVLRQLADEYIAAEAEVIKAQEALEIAVARKRDIAENLIPQATDGMDGRFNLGDGRELIVKEEIRSSIAGEKRIPAIQWLDENGYGHIVKREISVEFAKGDTERCEAFLQALKNLEAQLGTLVVKTNFTVHHATLNSWVKERLSEGVDLPVDVFGIFRQRTAKVILPN